MNRVLKPLGEMGAQLQATCAKLPAGADRAISKSPELSLGFPSRRCGAMTRLSWCDMPRI